MKEQYEVKRLDRPVDWTVDVPGSKSMTNRALLMAALSDGEVKLEGVLFYICRNCILLCCNYWCC